MNERELAVQKDVYRSREPKILLVDLETTPILGWSWDGWDTTLLDVEQDTKILCFAYKWLGQKQVRTYAIWDAEDYKPNRFNIDDSEVVLELWKLFNEADIIVAQNGDKFDIRTANARFLFYRLAPPADYKSVDTLKIARKYFKMPFHSLDHMLRYLKMERKVDPGSKKTWFDCMNGVEPAQKHMLYYNRADVDRLEMIYKAMRGWHKTHPILNLYTRKLNHCPVCQSKNMIKNGPRPTKGGIRQKWACKECGHPWTTDYQKEDIKLDIVR